MIKFKLRNKADIWDVADWMNDTFGYHKEEVTWFWNTYVEPGPLNITGLELLHEGVAIWAGTPEQHTLAMLKWS